MGPALALGNNQDNGRPHAGMACHPQPSGLPQRYLVPQHFLLQIGQLFLSFQVNKRIPSLPFATAAPEAVLPGTAHRATPLLVLTAGPALPHAAHSHPLFSPLSSLCSGSTVCCPALTGA